MPRPHDPLAYLFGQIERIPLVTGESNLLDVARKAEEVMEALGWNLRDPEQVSREPEFENEIVKRISLRRMAEQQLQLQIYIYRSRELSTHVALKAREESRALWTVATDGRHWAIFGPPDAQPNPQWVDITQEDASVRLRRLLSQASNALSWTDFEQGHPTEITPDDTSGAAKSKGRTVSWPEQATHAMMRKGCRSFMSFDFESRRATLLPGSLLRAKVGSSLPNHHRKIREDALAAAILLPSGPFLRLTSPLTVNSPSAAATLVTGTLTSGWVLWRDREGNSLNQDDELT